MYRAKEAGKDRVILYERRMSKESDTKLPLKMICIGLLKNEEFELYYQPQFNKFDNLGWTWKVLLRWNSPRTFGSG